MKKILMLATGGTIVSQMSENGLEPSSASEELFKCIEEFRKYYSIDFKCILNLDSSNIQPEEWKLIAANVYEGLEYYDGIVITHGTDTLAYTASMLSFMLQNVKKSVILTGSQLPIHMPLSDARTNLATAFSAVDHQITGVNIAFHYKIIKGCRAVKVRTMGFNAFESVNYPYLSEISADNTQCYDFNKPQFCASLDTVLKSNVCNEVFLLKLIPGTDPKIFDFLLSAKYRGVVLEAFGAGGLHFIRRDLLEKIKSLVDNGVAVVVCSQCLYEHSDLSIYEPGRKIMSTGVIPARDMTTEAAVTKLMWALGQTNDLAKVNEIFDTNYSGEVTL